MQRWLRRFMILMKQFCMSMGISYYIFMSETRVPLSMCRFGESCLGSWLASDFPGRCDYISGKWELSEFLWWFKFWMTSKLCLDHQFHSFDSLRACCFANSLANAIITKRIQLCCDRITFWIFSSESTDSIIACGIFPSVNFQFRKDGESSRDFSELNFLRPCGSRKYSYHFCLPIEQNGDSLLLIDPFIAAIWNVLYRSWIFYAMILFTIWRFHYLFLRNLYIGCPTGH
jgi:hypothetical protein